MDRGTRTAEAAAAAPGGVQEFEALYTASFRRLVTQVYLVTGDADEARDCVQEAFARAWLRWDRLRDGVDQPVAWVSTVAYRIAVSGWRRRRVATRALHRLGPPDPTPGPSAEAVAVASALARLPHGSRAVVVLHYYEGLRVEDIAAQLGLSASAVKSRLARARAALAPMLQDPEDHDA
jgi:RNA polymerase sigma-70 factor, ECF subfamily